MRSSAERTLRMEHLCWRIWHIARKKRLVNFSLLYGIDPRTSMVVAERQCIWEVVVFRDY